MRHTIRQIRTVITSVVATACISLVMPGAEAAVTFRSASQNAFNTITHIAAGTFDDATGCGAGNAITPTTPAGNTNDLLIVSVNVRENAATVTTTSGWTQFYNDLYGPGGADELRVQLYWRVADGTANDTITLTQTGTCDVIAANVSRFRGVDTTSPILVGPSATKQNANNVDTPSIDTSGFPNAMVVVSTFVADDRTVLEGVGWSQSFDDTATTGRDWGTSLNYQLQTTAGLISITDWALSGGTLRNYGVIYALRPARQLSSGLTVNVPAGTTINDIMIATVAVSPSTLNIATPAGWTLQNTVTQATATSNRQYVFSRVVTGVEPASYNWGISGTLTSAGAGVAGGIVSFIGVDTDAPFNVAPTGNVTASATTHQANAITTTVADVMVVSAHSYSSTQPWFAPGGMTERVDIGSLTTTNAATANANGISLQMATVVQPVAGTTGNKTATVGGNADTGVGSLMALTPLVATATVFAQATGGSAISADTNSTTGSGAYTSLSGLEIRETSNGGMLAGNYTLTAPTGFQFDTGTNVSISVGTVSGTGTDMVLSSSSVTPTSSTITFTVATPSSGTRLNSLTFSNLRVRPTADCPLATTGNIVFATPTLTTISSSNAGTLTEVVGAAAKMYTVMPGQTAYSSTSCGSVSGAPLDQFEDLAFNISKLVVTDQFGNIQTSYDNAGVAITYTYTGGGSSIYTTPVNFTDGQSTTTLATTFDVLATGVTLTASASGLTGIASTAFNVLATPALPAAVAIYRMEQSSWTGAANEVLDTSGNNLHATALNGSDTSNAIPAIAGNPGTCNYGVFDQVDDLIRTPDNALLDIPTTLTVSVWVYAFNWPGSGLKTILSKDENYEFHITSTGQINWWWGGGAQELFSATPLPVNEWHHVTIVYNAGVSSIYIDGVLDVTDPSDGVGTLTLNADPLEIAADQAFAGRNFDGWIDEVRIYNAALSAPQINHLKNLTAPCTNPPTFQTRLADWHLDGPWSGTGDTIPDFSGNNYSGTTTNSPDNLGLVCNAANLSANSATDFMSMNVNALDNRTNFSISTWVKTSNTGNQALLSGARAAQFNELIMWFPTNTTFRPVLLGSALGGTTITIPSLTAVNPDISAVDNTWHHVVWTRNGATNCVYVDGALAGCLTGQPTGAVDIEALIVGQEQDSVGGGFSNTEDWEGYIDELMVFNGVLTMADIQSIYYNQLAGNNYDGSNRNCPVVRYNISHDGSGVSCLAETITITAIDAHGDATDPGNVTLALSVIPLTGMPPVPAKGTWSYLISPLSGTLSANSNTSGTANFQFPGDGSTSVQLAFNYATLASGNTSETINFNVIDTNNIKDTLDFSVITDPNITFSLTGFQFYNYDSANEIIQTQIAGKPSNVAPLDDLLALRAVRVSDTNAAVCEAAFPAGSSITIPMGAECRNPGTCSARQVRINSTPIATNNDNLTTGTTSYTNVVLNFEDDGTASGITRAPLVINYPDAGRIQLHARYEIPLADGNSPPTGPGSGGFMSGSSQQFIVRPFALAITDILDGVTPNPRSLLATGTKFAAAGADFSVKVGAYLWEANDDDGIPWGTAFDGIPDSRTVGIFTEGVNITDNTTLVGSALAPSYRADGVLLASAVYAPSGGVLGTLNNGAIVSGDFNGAGQAPLADLQYMEVGTFMMTAQFNDYLADPAVDIVGASYWNGTLDSSSNPSGAIGRFVPYDFDVSLNVPKFTTQCTAFTYVGQPFTFTDNPEITVTARAKGGSTTANYTGTFNRLSTGSISYPGGTNEGFSEGSPGALGLDTGLITGWLPTITDMGAGTVKLAFSFGAGQKIAFNRTAPVVPFDAEISLALNVIDQDGVFYGNGSGTSINPARFGNTGAGQGITFSTDKEQRWGRLVVNNAFGSELLPLTMGLQSEYYLDSSSGFVSNIDDNCTLYQGSNSIVTDANVGDTLTTADVAVSLPAAPTGLVAGVSSPVNPLVVGDNVDPSLGPGITGPLIITLNLSVSGSAQDWLQFDWDNTDGLNDGPYDDNPYGRASFGIFKGPREYIYIREPWN
jgi:MSHA biogenesis protein MshQ